MSVVHKVTQGLGKTVCCHTSVFDLPRTDRITHQQDLVNCTTLTEEEKLIAGLELGLYPKYDVINRASGELVTDPVFVLKPDSDPLARAALATYMQQASVRGFEVLAADLKQWLDQLG